MKARALIFFLRDEQGQDLVEYALVVAFVALASAALFLGDGPPKPPPSAQPGS